MPQTCFETQSTEVLSLPSSASHGACCQSSSVDTCCTEKLCATDLWTSPDVQGRHACPQMAWSSDVGRWNQGNELCISVFAARVSAGIIYTHIFNQLRKLPCISHLTEVLPKPNLQLNLTQAFRSAFPGEASHSEETCSFPLKFPAGSNLPRTRTQLDA